MPGQDIVDRIEAELERCDPGAVLAFALDCPDCGHFWQAVIDIAPALWAEVQAAAERTSARGRCARAQVMAGAKPRCWRCRAPAGPPICNWQAHHDRPVAESRAPRPRRADPGAARVALPPRFATARTDDDPARETWSDDAQPLPSPPDAMPRRAIIMDDPPTETRQPHRARTDTDEGGSRLPSSSRSIPRRGRFTRMLRRRDRRPRPALVRRRA